jgi:hypothetical protein
LADGGHEDVIDEAIDDFAKGDTKDDADGHVEDVAAEGEVFEFFDESHISIFSARGGGLGGSGRCVNLGNRPLACYTSPSATPTRHTWRLTHTGPVGQF